MPRTDDAGRDLAALIREGLDRSIKVVLHGDGGVGKSTLAYEVAARFARDRHIGLAWVTAAGTGGFSVTDFSGPLSAYLDCEPSIVGVCAALQRGPYLLVLDNADSAEAALPMSLATAFPGNCWFLATSRVLDGRFGGVGTSVHLDVMNSEEARRFTREEAARQGVRLEISAVDAILGISQRNPEVIRWLLGQAAAMDRLDLATQEVRAGAGEAAEQVFGRTWDNLTLEERTALCALSVIPSGTREAVAEATADPAADQTLGRLRQWAVAVHDGRGSWSVTGLTRSMAQTRIFEVLDQWLERAQDGDPRATASTLAFWTNTDLQEFLRIRGLWPQRVQYGESIIPIARGAGDPGTIAVVAGNLATAHMDTGDMARAFEGHVEARDAFRELGDNRNVAAVLHLLGILAQRQGEIPNAERLYGESLEIKRGLGDQQGIATGLHQLGRLAQDRGDPLESERLYGESLEIARGLGNQEGIAITLAQRGLLLEQQGALPAAAASLEEAQEIFLRLGSPMAEQAARELARVRARLAEGGGPRTEAQEAGVEEPTSDTEEPP